jgi:hypothetical protein
VRLQGESGAAARLVLVTVDSTIVRAHQNAAGALKKGLWSASPPITRSDAPAAG